MASLWEVQRRFGPYETLRLLGEGAMGAVVLATHERNGALVALKTLSDEALTHAIIAEAFRTEARLSLELKHPNLVAAVDADLEGKRPWIAFEYVAGSDLEEMVEHEGPLDPWLATSIVLDVAYGLAAAHQKNVLHRDIKPANILLTGNGTVKLIDFGAAAATPLPEDRTEGDGLVDELESSLPFAGTMAYAAPEQIQGKDVEAASDLYSLGLVFWKLLTGEVLLPSPNPFDHVLAQCSLLDRLPSLRDLRPEIPESLDEVLRGMLSFSPDERSFGSAIKLGERLEAMLAAAGRNPVQRRSQRVLARLALAETDYERARGLIRMGRHEEALVLLRSLLDLPADVAASYRMRIRRETRDLLLDLQARWTEEGSDPAATKRYILTLGPLAAFARQAEDDELILLLERRLATLVQALPTLGERNRALLILSGLVPQSIILGRCTLALAEGAGRPELAGRVRDVLARICLRRDRPELAHEICLAATPGEEAFDGLAITRLTAREAERKRAQRKRGVEGALEGPDLADQLPAQEALMGEYLATAPGDFSMWERLASLLARQGRSDEAFAALRQCAVEAMMQDDLDRARRLFARILRDKAEALEEAGFLLEIELAFGRPAPAVRCLRQAFLTLLLRYGHGERAASWLAERLDGGRSDGEEIATEAAQVARAEEAPGIVTLTAFALGRIALARGDGAAVKQHFSEAIATSMKPSLLVQRMLILPGLRDHVSSFDLQRLKSLRERELRGTLSEKD